MINIFTDSTLKNKLEEINFGKVEAGSSKELELSYLLGVLIMNDKTSGNHPKYIELASNESKFRNELVAKLNSKNSNKIQTILKNQSISQSNIKKESISKNFEEFNPMRFLELIISKKDLKIVQLFSKRSILNEKEMKEFISS